LQFGNDEESKELQPDTTENFSGMIQESMKIQKVKATNSWRTIGCNGVLNLNPNFPKIDGQYYIVH